MTALRCFGRTILTFPFLAVFVGVVVLSPSRTVFCQSPSTNLPEAVAIRPDNPIKREMRADEVHRYHIAMVDGQFAEMSLVQSGIETTISVADPDGKRLMEFDAGKSKGAIQPIRIAADRSGNYIISVRPRTQNAPAGQYEIKLNDLRQATDMDRATVESFKLYLDGKSLDVAGKYDEALAKVQSALEIIEKSGIDAENEKADILNVIAGIYLSKADYKNSHAYYQRALAAYEKTYGPEHNFVAVLLNNIGFLYRITGEYDKSEQMYLRALDIDEKIFGPDHTEVGNVLNNLAFLYYTRGHYSRAEPLYYRALAIKEKAMGPVSMDVARLLNNLALIHRSRGDYPKAIEDFKRALEIAQKALPQGHPSLAGMLNNLGAVSTDVGDFDSGEKFFEGSLAIREKNLGPEHPDLANTLANLGSLFDQKGDSARAEQYYKRALAIREKAFAADHPMVATSLGSLGLLYIDRSDYAKAEPLLNRALDISEKKLGREHTSVAGILANLGLLYTNSRNFEKAEPLLQRSIAIYEKAVGPSHPLLARPLSTMATLYSAKKEVDRALAIQEKYLAIRDHNLDLNLFIGSERQKLAYIDTLLRDVYATVSMHSQAMPHNSKAKEMALSLILSRKGRSLDAMSESNFVLRQRADAADKKLIDQLSDARTQLATLTLRGPANDKPEVYQQNLKSLEATREKLEDEISRRSGELRRGSRKPSLTELRAHLPVNAALVEFVSYEPESTAPNAKSKDSSDLRYAVYVIRRQGEIEWKDLGDAAAIDKAVEGFRAAMRDPKRKDVKQLARDVDEKVMRPVRGIVGDATHLLISPDGELNLVPFDAVVDEQNRYLTERYLVTYLTSGRDLARTEHKTEGVRAPMIFADPDFGDAPGELVASTKAVPAARRRQSVTVTRELSGTYFAPLRGTAAEADAIRRLFPAAVVRTAQDATESSLKTVRAPQILHIATHGFFLTKSVSSPDPGKAATQTNPLLRSGLALFGANNRGTSGEDGILTALEASGLDLWGTKLVVLSACDTGVGEVRTGEGVFGLRRAFSLAGAESLVMSLWPVSDFVTRELMVGYYQNLRQGLGRGESLRRAKLEMMRRPGRNHPFYWASFIQSGEWAGLDGMR